MANTPTDTTRNIPSLNFDTPIGIEDLEFGIAEVLTEELTYRLQIAMQYVQSGGPRYGIVDDLNPASISTSSTRSFAVAENANTLLTIDVQPGVAVTKTGHIVILGTEQEAVSLADTTNSVENVVFVEYETVEDSDYNVETRYGNVASKRSVRPIDSLTVQVVTLDDFQNTSIFPTARLNEVVVLAVVTPTGTAPPAAATELSFDFTQSSYSWNRPWFSVIDIEHRNELGTGSSSTPHNLGLSDLSQGDLTLYQQMLNHGIVLSRDLDIPGCPGKLCYESVPYNSVLTDTTGDVTGISGALYARLQDFPIRIVGAFSNTDSDNAIAVWPLPQSNILVIAGSETIPNPEGFTVRYTSATACKPPTEVVTNDEMQVGTPESHELVVSGGTGFNTLNQATYSFGASGPIPKNFNVYCDGDGDLYVSPQIVLCYTKLDDIGTSIHELDDVTLKGLAPARIGLTIGGGAYPSLDIQIKVTGKDKDDLTVNETLTFLAGTWTQPVTGPGERETATNFEVTTQLYRSIDSIQVTNRVGDSASSAIVVYADVEPDAEAGVFDVVNDMLPVAHVIWNGVSVDQIRDARPVSSVLKVPSRTTEAMKSLQATMGALITTSLFSGTSIDDAFVVLAEDLDDLYYVDYDNSRLFRHADGLRSTFDPNAIDTDTDPIWTSRAVELTNLPNAGGATNAYLMVILEGYDVFSRYRPYPRLSVRRSTGAWGAWNLESGASVTPDRMVYRIDFSGETAFKIQLRVQGAVKNVQAFMARS